MCNIFNLDGQFLGTSKSINHRIKRDRVRRLQLIPNQNIIVLNPQPLELKPEYPELTELRITLEESPIAL